MIFHVYTVVYPFVCSLVFMHCWIDMRGDAARFYCPEANMATFKKLMLWLPESCKILSVLHCNSLKFRLCPSLPFFWLTVIWSFRPWRSHTYRASQTSSNSARRWLGMAWQIRQDLGRNGDVWNRVAKVSQNTVIIGIITIIRYQLISI
jgi:hypothetical protein